jgi:protein-tyrosine-phosphatase
MSKPVMNMDTAMGKCKSPLQEDHLPTAEIRHPVQYFDNSLLPLSRDRGWWSQKELRQIFETPHYNILFPCTGNSARSIMAEAIMNRKGFPNFKAYSAGSHPSGVVRPEALQQIESTGLSTEGLHSKSWDEFANPDGPHFDFVFTVCDFNQLASPSKAHGISAGTNPADRVHPVVVEVIKEVGIDLNEAKPQKLTAELAHGAELLVTMGCGDECPYVPGLRRADWPLQDAKGLPMDEMRAIRETIRSHVQRLIEEEQVA